MNAPPGVVLGREGGQLRVLTPDGEVRAILRGKAKRGDDRAVVGDHVELSRPDDKGLWAIQSVNSRRNVLARGTPDRRRRRAIAANLDHLYVLVASTNPAPIPQLIDRLLVLAAADDIPASVILNKIDLDPGEAIGERMTSVGYPLHRVSAQSGEGLDALFAQLHSGVSAVAGPSGAGKSTLLNMLQPGLSLLTNPTSAGVERGKNTTVAAIMVPLAAGGFLVDTPGVSEIGLWGLDPTGLIDCFPEFAHLKGQCRFANCRHQVEPDCRVRAEAATDKARQSRYESYLTFANDLNALPETWE